MIARLEMKLKIESEKRISGQKVSLFQGALMELLDEEYVEFLHESKLHPYSQHLEVREKNWYWVVNCLDQEAVNKIIIQALMPIERIYLKKDEIEIQILEKKYTEKTSKDLMNSFYEEEKSRYLNLHFVTPTAFKSGGKYVFYPDIRCIYQSCMNKYDAVMKEESMTDEETLEQLCANSQVVHYDLKSVYFHMEGIRIPSFIGKITIKLHGNQTMTNFAHMLMEFGTYSGIGIKSAVGMGAMKLLDERRKSSD